MKLVARRWRVPKTIWALFAAELPVTISILALFSIAAPDLYRTRLWEDGYKNGFNSDPTEVLYEEVNGQPVVTPLVWSQFVTDYNVIISVLSTFILLTKAVMFALHLFIPLLSVAVHALLAALFGYSISCQTASDTTDPQQPQNGPPWYITKSCNVAYYKKNVGYCEQAKATFAITIVLIVLFSINTLVALWSAFPTKDERRARETTVEEADTNDTTGSEQKSQNRWEMNNLSGQEPPATPGVQNPRTPRTKAFNQLSRDSNGAGPLGYRS